MKDEQGIYNIIATVFFLVVASSLIYILQLNVGLPNSIDAFSFILLSLAVLRITRLVVYDKIAEWFRDLFTDIKRAGDDLVRTKPKSGVKKTVHELVHCPWCVGMWSALVVSFFFFYTPYAWFPIFALALSALSSFMQILSNMIGWYAEGKKHEVNSRS